MILRILLCAAGAAVLLLLGSGYLLFRYAMARRPFPWSRERPDVWVTPPTQRMMNGKPYDPFGWGERTRAADGWMYARGAEPGTRHTIRSHDGLTLAGHYLAPENGVPPRAIFLMIHGYRSDARFDFAIAVEELSRDGYGCFLADQRAHGESEGKYITFGVLERFDVVRWAQYLESAFPGVPVILDGISMGAASVMAAAGETLPSNVCGVVADCGYTCMRDIFGAAARGIFHLPPFPFVPLAELFSRLVCGVGFSDVESGPALARVRVPVLLAHGEADSLVPFSMGQQILHECEGKCDVSFFSVPEADHGLSYLGDHDGYRAALSALLERCPAVRENTKNPVITTRQTT